MIKSSPAYALIDDEILARVTNGIDSEFVSQLAQVFVPSFYGFPIGPWTEYEDDFNHL